jgi:hypothetical protein
MTPTRRDAYFTLISPTRRDLTLIAILFDFRDAITHDATPFRRRRDAMTRREPRRDDDADATPDALFYSTTRRLFIS